MPYNAFSSLVPLENFALARMGRYKLTYRLPCSPLNIFEECLRDLGELAVARGFSHLQGHLPNFSFYDYHFRFLSAECVSAWQDFSALRAKYFHHDTRTT
jgi:hypothetical protein